MSPVLEQLATVFDSVVWEESHGQDVARVPVEIWGEFALAAKEVSQRRQQRRQAFNQHGKLTEKQTGII